MYAHICYEMYISISTIIEENRYAHSQYMPRLVPKPWRHCYNITKVTFHVHSTLTSLSFHMAISKERSVFLKETL